MKSVASLVNYFFANFDELYFDMGVPEVSSVVEKMDSYIKAKADFNFEYANKMPFYFFKKVS